MRLGTIHRMLKKVAHSWLGQAKAAARLLDPRTGELCALHRTSCRWQHWDRLSTKPGSGCSCRAKDGRSWYTCLKEQFTPRTRKLHLPILSRASFPGPEKGSAVRVLAPLPKDPSSLCTHHPCLAISTACNFSPKGSLNTSGLREYLHSPSYFIFCTGTHN